jgi:hypothetical protein
MLAIVKTMEIDEAVKFLYSQRAGTIGDWNMAKLSVRLKTLRASGSATSSLPNHSSALLDFQ